MAINTKFEHSKLTTSGNSKYNLNWEQNKGSWTIKYSNFIFTLILLLKTTQKVEAIGTPISNKNTPLTVKKFMESMTKIPK